MIKFKEVEFGSNLYQQLLTIREDVLRKPIGMQLRAKDTANDANEFHIAAINKEQPIGCVLLCPVSKNVVQLRQMAILDSYRGKNIGAQLVGYAEKFAISKGYLTIETRARKVVEGFYKKLGYETFRNEFEDEHTFLMRKPLI